MKRVIISYFVGVVAGVLAVCWILLLRPTTTPTPTATTSVVVDTVRLLDTVVVSHDRFIVQRDTVADTVYIPITRHHFDTIVERVRVSGVVEGWHAALDSLIVECVPQPPSKPSPWAVGFNVGVGATPAGLLPYFGVGINLDLIRF